MSMLVHLAEAKLVLPQVLNTTDGWSTVYADTERPKLSRVWRPFGPFRIYLHILEPCKAEEAFYHPHPWPMATEIQQGQYEQCSGHGDPDAAQGPPVTDTRVFRKGDAYEIMDPNTWHSVRPLDTLCLTFMISGIPYEGSSGQRRGNTPSRPLEYEELGMMLYMFRSLMLA